MTLFPFAEYWWFYAIFTLFVLGMLALDLGVFHRKEHVVSIKEATVWTAVWVALAGVFGVAALRLRLVEISAGRTAPGSTRFRPGAAAWNVMLEFYTGYIIEETLSVDNIFVFVLVFSYFAIPRIYQHRVLFYGILGALVFRALFIGAGSLLMQFHWVIYVFGGVLDHHRPSR